MVSGTPIRRPRGRSENGNGPEYEPCKCMDCELEVAFVVTGSPIQLSDIVHCTSKQGWCQTDTYLISFWSCKEKNTSSLSSIKKQHQIHKLSTVKKRKWNISLTLVCFKRLGGFKNFKKSIFFAHLIIQYVENILYYVVLESTTLCKLKKKFHVLFECKNLIAFFSKLYFWNR